MGNRPFGNGHVKKETTRSLSKGFSLFPSKKANQNAVKVEPITSLKEYFAENEEKDNNKQEIVLTSIRDESAEWKLRLRELQKSYDQINHMLQERTLQLAHTQKALETQENLVKILQLNVQEKKIPVDLNRDVKSQKENVSEFSSLPPDVLDGFSKKNLEDKSRISSFVNGNVKMDNALETKKVEMGYQMLSEKEIAHQLRDKKYKF